MLRNRHKESRSKYSPFQASGLRTHGSNAAHRQQLHCFGIKGQKHTGRASAHTAHMLYDATSEIPAIFRDTQSSRNRFLIGFNVFAVQDSAQTAETNSFLRLYRCRRHHATSQNTTTGTMILSAFSRKAIALAVCSSSSPVMTDRRLCRHWNRQRCTQRPAVMCTEMYTKKLYVGTCLRTTPRT